MDELEARVRRALQTQPHDLVASEELDRRIEAGLREGSPVRWPLAAVAAAIALLLVAGLLRGSGGEPTEVAMSRTSAIKGWDLAKRPPMGLRSDASMVWTDREAIVWGGVGDTGSERGKPSNEGAAYDPEARRWRLIQDAPVAGRYAHAAVWTGREVIVLGGVTDRTRTTPNMDGAAYDPDTDTWRRIADAPLPGGAGHAAVWTGREVLVWGRTTDDGYSSEGAAYDPAADVWRPLPPLPGPRRERPVLLAVPGGAVAFARVVRADLGSQERGAVMEIDFFDEATQAWVTLPASGISPLGDPTPVVIGGELAVIGSAPDELDEGARVAGLYEFGAATWRPMAGVDTSPRGGWVGQFAPVWTGRELVVVAKLFGTGGSTALRAYTYDTTADQWRRVPDPPEPPAAGQAYWTGSQVIAWTERGLLTSR